MFKKCCSLLLCAALLILPLSGMTLTAFASTTQPVVTVNIAPYDTVAPSDTITVTYAARGGYTLTACDTRLENVSLGTGTTVSFTPASRNLADGLYTLVMTATDSAGETTYQPLTFKVDTDAEANYTIQNGTITTDKAVATYAATALDVSAFYGTTQDGSLSLNGLGTYSAQENYDLRYTDASVTASSAAGLPYQVFGINLNGKTSGKVTVAYSGSTLEGERIAVKVYRPSTGAWDTVGSFIGSGTVSEQVDIATYNCGGKIYAAAVLDYVTNGADTMIWSTDPQHYTKFPDLYEYYYKIYEFAAEGYKNGDFGYIFTTGDLVDDRPYAEVAPRQWGVASKALAIAEEAGMPAGVVTGNHDVADFTPTDYSAGPNTTSDYSKFWEYFPATRFNQTDWYGGSLNNNRSHYDLVTVGNVDFIILQLGYGFEADDETIAWANDVLETYRHRVAIVSTHQYLQNNTADRYGRAELIFSKIVDPNPNVKMVLCGHDDGSLCLEKKASDGRTVYEILADYQFVEAEDPDFYANEHYIGSVPSCCGDGYVRLLSVEGDTLSSITYSPVTDRYNPYGDRENLTIDLEWSGASRTLTTTGFSAAVLGSATTSTSVDRVAVIGGNTYTPVLYASVPSAPGTSATPAATPAHRYYAHSASAAPTVSQKADFLSAAGFSNGVTIGAWTTGGNYSSAPLNFRVDLTKTPYLYYSIQQPADSNFCFSFISDMTTANWLTFLDATKGNAALNITNDAWNAYQNHEQYVTTSETGCIDMRDYVTDPNATWWEIDQVTFYNKKLQNVIIDYMFFGSGDGYNAPSGPTAADRTALSALISKADQISSDGYTAASVSAMTSALNTAKSALNSSATAVQAAYTKLSHAIGALTKENVSFDPATLTSVKNYSLSLSNWTNNSVPKTTQHDDGFILQNTRTEGNMWAAVTNYSSYTVYPERDQVFLKLDVDTENAWIIQINITQNGVTGTVHLNSGIENGFSSPDADGMEGLFQDIYDVSDAFEQCGFDPSATFTVNSLMFYTVGFNSYTDVRHIEFFTNKSDGIVDGGNLQRAIARAELRTRAYYTSASWNAMQTVLTNAKTALKNTALGEADLNLYALQMNNAVDALVFAGSYPEKAGSLLPSDPGLWKLSDASAITVSRPKNIVTIQNTNGLYPYAEYKMDDPVRAFTDESRLIADFDVGAYANIYLQTNVGDISLIPYLTPGTTNDLPKGTYKLDIPLSEMDAFAGTSSITIYGVRVFSVGEAASSAVTIRTLRISEYDNYDWSTIDVDYGVAATPNNPYYAHCAPYAPEVTAKVDLLPIMGLDEHPVNNGWYRVNTTVNVDLNKTPYLYYSVAVPQGSSFTFGFFNSTANAPYFVFRDATKTSASDLMSYPVTTWDSYTNGEQYLTQSETGCIDMRTLLTDTSNMTWSINSLSFYNPNDTEVTISYMFFGSYPAYVESNVQIDTPDQPIEPDVPALEMGDVNGDGKITTYDARVLMLEVLSNAGAFTAEQIKAADMTGDGKLSTSDVRLIVLKALTT